MSGGKRVTITPQTLGGGQIPAEQLRKLGDAASKATDSLSKAGKAADEGAKAQERAVENLRSVASASVTGVASGAISALGQRGAGATDAGIGAFRGLQAGLPALGAALGAASPLPGGAAIGGLLGTAGGALLNRTDFARDADARDAAKAEVKALGSPLAAAGIPVDEESIARAFQQANLAAGRQLRFEETVNRVTNRLPSS